MKIKRYFAPDIKQAIRMVREEQGPDAVILSNRKVDGGIEIVAAQDFDEQAMNDWSAADKNNPPPRTAKPAAVAAPVVKMSESRRRAEEVFREALEAKVQPAVKASEPAHKSEVKPFPFNKIPQIRTEEPQPQARPERKVEPVRAQPAKQKPVQAESVSASLLQELQKEMRHMRRAMDAHFSGTAWDGALSKTPARLDILRQLSAYGFSKKLSMLVANRLGSVEDLTLAWQGCQDLLASQLPIAEDNLLDYGGIVALVGPTGVGKTTTIAKLAAKFRLKHGPRQIALITTDNYRIGAHDQLSTYGRILDVPVRTASSNEELRAQISSFYDKRLILIDTAGMGPRDMRLADQSSLLNQDQLPIKTYLVLSAATQAQVMSEAIRAFAGFSPNACILTKLDETQQLGAALSTLVEKQLPVSLVTDGQQVPEDLHLARTSLLLERCFASVPEEWEEETLNARSFAHEDWVAQANV